MNDDGRLIKIFSNKTTMRLFLIGFLLGGIGICFYLMGWSSLRQNSGSFVCM